MNSRTLLAILAAGLFALAAACTTGSSTPTAEPTPTPEPVSLVTEDPNANPDAFLAALPADEVSCAEDAAGGRDQLAQMIAYEDQSGVQADAATAGAVVDCFSESSAKGVLVGQFDRMAGGLSDQTIACMTDQVSSVALVALLSSPDTAQADSYLSLFRTIFCMNDSERTAIETSAGESFGIQRVGYIDSLECAFDYRDADGNSVIDQVFAFIETQSADGTFDPTSAEGSAQLSALFEFIPIAVECELVTDEDFAESPFTADQLACISEQGGQTFAALMEQFSGSANATPEADFGQLAQLMQVLDDCGISLDQLSGDLMIPTEESTPQTEPTVDVPSFDELDLPITEEQAACLESYVDEEAIQEMLQTGQPPANLFEALEECDISLEELLQAS